MKQTLDLAGWHGAMTVSERRPAQMPLSPKDLHPLTDVAANDRLYRYESSVKQAFDDIVPVLKEIATERCEPDFTSRAQGIAERAFGFSLPTHILDAAWATGLDMRRLFAWCVFETYRRMSDEFFTSDPLGGRQGDEFQAFLQQCGFHLMDVTPCADGRLPMPSATCCGCRMVPCGVSPMRARCSISRTRSRSGSRRS